MPQRKANAHPKPKLQRKRRLNQELEDCEIVDVATSSRREQKIRLKIKINAGKDAAKNKKPTRKEGSGTSTSRLMIDEIASVDNDDLTTSQMKEGDDEEAWLDALEKGDLDDYGELKKEKDLSLMTARQRAMTDRTTGCTSFMPATLLPGSGSKVEVMTEEAQKKKEEKNKRRKLQAVKKAEESQKQTIERLVKHQGARGSKDRQKKVNASFDAGTNNTPQQTTVKAVPMIKYISRGNLITISFPENMDCPLKSKFKKEINLRAVCYVCGCPKKYNCSKTKVPLCSLKCYKSNLAKEGG